MDTRYYKNYKLTIKVLLASVSTLILFTIIAIINPSKTSAATNTAIANGYPIAGQSETLTAGGAMVNPNARPWFAVGVGAYNGAFTYAKVYVPVGTVATLTIHQGAGVCPIDVGAPSVLYSAYALGSDETYNGSVPVTAQNNGVCSAGPSGDRTLALNGGNAANAIVGHGGYKVFYFEAFIRNGQGTGDNEKSFWLQVNNGQIGISRSVKDYGTTQNGFGIYQRDIGVNGTATMWNFEFQFAPRCGEANSPVPTSWQIFDYDNGVYNPPAANATPNAAVLQSDLKGGPYSWSTTDTWADSILGGNGATTTHKFTADNTYRYKLRFNHVNWHNTLQIQVPYDSFDADQSIVCYLAVCTGTSPGSATASINTPRNVNVTFTNAGLHALDAGDDLRMTQGGSVTTIANPGFAAGAPHTFTVTVARGSPGSYTFVFQMMHNGAPLPQPPSTQCVFTLNVRAPAILDADCNNTPIDQTLQEGYAPTTATFSVTNTGFEDWSNGNYRLMDLGPVPLNPAAGGFYILHHQVEGTNNNVPPKFPYNSDTFDLPVPAGLGVGNYTYNFQMSRRDVRPSGTVITGFGQVCQLNIHVQLPRPSPGPGTTLTVDCHQLTMTVHFNTPIANVPSGSGPVIQVVANDAFAYNTPPYPVTGGNGDFTATADPYSATWPTGLYWQLYPWNKHTFILYWYSPDDGSYTPMNVSATLERNQCMVPNCLPGSAGNPEPGEPHSIGQVGGNFTNYTNMAFSGYRSSIGWSGNIAFVPPIGNPSSYSLPVGGNSSQFMGLNPATVATPNSGTINVNNYAPDGNLINSCSLYVVAYTKPYLKVFNGDVSAGGGFNTLAGSTNNCSASVLPPIPGNIKAFANPDAANNGIQKRAGSSADFGVFLMGVIVGSDPVLALGPPHEGFYSGLPTPGVYRNLYNPTSFANYGVPPWGGSFVQHCINDFYDEYAPNTNLNPASSYIIPFTPGNNIAGFTVIAPKLALSAAAPIQGHQTVVVNGDVFIGSDIRYTDWTWTGIPYQPPLLTLVVKGNIFIGHNVGRLDGIFIAQPTGPSAGGQIFTCMDGADAIPTSTTILSACNNRLMVNGSFIAQHIHFNRIADVNGTLRTAALNPNPETYAGAFKNNAAEKFSFTPESLLASPAYTNSSTSTTNPVKVDSLISLPPLF